MSITSANDLSVNNSLSVNGNMVLGSHLTSTLLINATTTIYNGLNIHGNIVQNWGSLSTGSDNVYLNGDVIIQNNKTLTTSIGLTTINGRTQANGDIYLLSGKSLYITDAYFSKYLRNYHDGTNAYIDYTGNLIFRNSETTTSLSISSSNNQATFNYNLNTNGITNSNSQITNNSTLSQVGLASFSNDIKVNIGQSIYIANSGLTNFLRMHHSGGAAYIDYTGGLNFRNSTTSSVSPTDTFNINSSSNQGTFNYNLNTTGITNTTNAIINNGVLTQNSTCNINSSLNVSGIPYFIGTSSNFPSASTYSTNKNGLEIYWDVQHPQGDSVFLNHSQGGSGGFNWWTIGTYHYRSNLMFLDNTSNLSLLNNISCVSINTTGDITCGGSLNLNSDVVIGDKLTVENGLILTGAFNQSKYFTIKGSTHNISGSTDYYYKLYDGTAGTSASENIQIHLASRGAKITYIYNSTYPSNLYQGCSEYMVYGVDYNAVERVWYVGSLQYQPIITCSSTGLINIEFAKNASLNGYIFWNISVFVM